ncbi:MAG: DNA mismatch repair protein MutS [Deltaproteobacteria bacterium]|nr:MAG: DNA mismatch repair protein MutS [Deltaproteobacteria bacterium]
MMRQYLDAKEAHPDCVLLFRMGDFYEVFFDDAELVARELDLTLTSRGKKDDDRIPMAGVPHHAADGYIRRLVERGHRVALCEQLEDPAQAKGIVRRGVVRIVTPGLLADDEAIEAKANHFLTALAVSSVQQGDVVAVASVDLSTGEFRICEEQTIDAVREELRRLRPAEIVVAEGQVELLAGAAELDEVPVTLRPDGALRLGSVVERCGSGRAEVDLLRQQVVSLGSAAIRERLAVLDRRTFRDRAAIDAAAALVLDYLHHTQGRVPAHLDAPVVYRVQDFVHLDPASAANLEIFETLMGGQQRGSLFSVIDRTVTGPGGRRLRTWLSYPLTAGETIRRRQAAVTALVDNLRGREAVRELLSRSADIQRVSSRLASGQAHARDLVRLGDTLGRIPELKTELASLPSERLHWLAERLDPCEDVRLAISEALVDEPPLTFAEGGVIRFGYDSRLDELVALSGSGKDWILRFESQERKRTGISSLKVKYNKVFGYYIEVTRANLDRVPEDYIRKQTLANAERYYTPELKEYEDSILTAEDERVALEQELFERLRQTVLAELGRLRDTARHLAEVDATAALAELAHTRGYVAPEIVDEPGIDIVEGRHPVVETMVPQGRFVPNDARLDADNRLILITGPNMAGKSTVIRQVALIVLLAQIGSHVPARSARIGVVDQIFSRVGASDNLTRGQSTFMVEMSETAHILRHATERSLVILDEIGRGTSTWDGLAIAWSVVEYLQAELRSFTLFATHYHELTELARELDGVRNCNIAVKEWNDEIIFLHKLVDGPANRSYGIQVARLAGVPDTVVDRARSVLSGLEETQLAGQPRPDGQRLCPDDLRRDQLSLFADVRPAPDPVMEELALLDVERMTPVDALVWLERARRSVVDRSPSIQGEEGSPQRPS